jgi:hypothetical protein
MPKTFKSMRVITGDGLELHGMMARHGEREGRAKAHALLPIVVSHRCRQARTLFAPA